LASMINGETIPTIQNRILDVGFADIDITLLGAHIYVSVVYHIFM